MFRLRVVCPMTLEINPKAGKLSLCPVRSSPGKVQGSGHDLKF